MENQIKLVQKPVIEHQLKEAGKKVSKRIADLNLENQVATTETVKFLKQTRSELRKEFNDFEEDRKTIKNAILNPYNEFDQLYKSEISEKYKDADSKLKNGIDSVEIKIKEEKEANLKAYFIELCQSMNIDFITFDKLNLDIKLSVTEKKYKEQINEFIEKISHDLELIKTQEFEAEIMAEYKISLDVAKSIKDVQDRKQRERDEAERIKQQQFNNRISKLFAIGMKKDDITGGYYYNDDIMIEKSKIESLEKGEFSIEIVKLEEKIKAEKKKNQPEQKPVEKQPEKKEPLKAPKVEQKGKMVIAQFEAKGTMAQLRKLGEYMKQNGITYKNI